MSDPYARAREALSFISPNCSREQWVFVGMGIQDELGEDGWSLWDEWSSTGDSYKPAEARAVWKSFKPGGGKGFGYVVDLAKQGGFDPRKRGAKPTPEVLAEREAKIAERKALHAAEEQVEAAEAAVKAKERWEGASPASPTHPYLKKKGIKPHGLKVGTWHKMDPVTGKILPIDNVLYLPIMDRQRAIQSLQGITTTGDKLYLSGGEKRGNFYTVGEKPQMVDGVPVFYFAEGFATAASVHEATAHLTLCCFDAGNIGHVVRAVRQRLPNARLVIMADNDTETEAKGKGNAGMRKAFEVAVETGAFVAHVPEGGDFNDLRLEHGDEAVRARAETAVVPTAAYEEKKPPASPIKATAAAADPASSTAHTSTRTAVARSPKPEATYNFGAPVDLFNVMPPPELPLDAFPASIANYARDQAALMGCDPAIVAMSALVAAASMIHDDLQIQPKRHDYEWRESARLWAAVVGDPSTQKSPGIAAGVRHVKAAEVMCGQANKAAEAEHIQKRDEWKREEKKREDKGAHPEPKPPARKRRMVGDITVEALSDVLADNPAGLLCFKDELSGWFGAMDAYKGGKGGGMDRAHWLESHSGGPRTVDRVHRGTIVVPNFSVCMLGGIQPAPMKRIASGIDHDGLLQRFIVLLARPRTKGEDRAPDANAKDAFAALFANLDKLQPTSKTVVLSDAAHAVRERIDEAARTMVAAFDHDHLQAWLGKWAGLFARLLLTMHVCECAEHGVYPTAEPVSGELACRVERLLCNSLLHHAIYFYTEMVDANQHHEHVRQLARLIVARGWMEVTRRDLAQNWKASRALDDRELNAVMGALCNFDWLAPVEGPVTHDGKPKAWAVNPQVHEAFAARAETERNRRVAAVNVLRELRANVSAANDPKSNAA